jgi:hypothetical protein
MADDPTDPAGPEVDVATLAADAGEPETDANADSKLAQDDTAAEERTRGRATMTSPVSSTS